MSKRSQLSGEAVRRARRERGIRQGDLAERSGLTQSTLSRIERGRIRSLQPEALTRLADALQVKADALTRPAPARDDPATDTLLRAFRGLSAGNRRIVLRFAVLLHRLERFDKESSAELAALFKKGG